MSNRNTTRRRTAGRRRKMREHAFSGSHHWTLPVVFSCNGYQLHDISGESVDETFERRTGYCIDAMYNLVPAWSDLAYFNRYMFNNLNVTFGHSGPGVLAQCIALLDCRTYFALITFYLEYHNTPVCHPRCQQRGSSGTHRSSFQGNTRHFRNLTEYSELHAWKMWGLRLQHFEMLLWSMFRFFVYISYENEYSIT